MTPIYNNDEYENCEDNNYPEISYIIYYPAGKYVFNRSLNLSSLPYRKYLNALKVVGQEYLNKTIGRIVSTPLDMDTKGIEILEVVGLGNLNRRNQKTLNEIKKKWCDKLNAICDVRDIIDENAVGEKIKCSVLKKLDDEFCKLAKALYPFIKETYIEEFDSNVKQFAKCIKEVRKSKKKISLDENIKKNESEIRDLNIQIELLNREKERIEKETERVEVTYALIKDEINNISKEDPEIKKKFIEGPGEIVKTTPLSFKQVRCLVAALKMLYGMSLTQVKCYFSDPRVKLYGINLWKIEDLYKSFTDVKSSSKYIRTGCAIIENFIKIGKIKI